MHVITYAVLYAHVCILCMRDIVYAVYIIIIILEGNDYNKRVHACFKHFTTIIIIIIILYCFTIISIPMYLHVFCYVCVYTVYLRGRSFRE